MNFALALAYFYSELSFGRHKAGLILDLSETELSSGSGMMDPDPSPWLGVLQNNGRASPKIKI